MKNSLLIPFYALIAIMVLSLGSMKFAHASDAGEDWGNQGYTQPAPSVEAMPDSLNEEMSSAETGASEVEATKAKPQMLASATSSAQMAAPEAPSSVTSESMSTHSGAPEDRGDFNSEAKMEHYNPADDSSGVTTKTTSSHGASNISSVKNTYGVMTEQNDAPKLYVAPYAGVDMFFGNQTVNTTPRYSAGASAGVLLSNFMIVNLSFTHSEQDVSNPILVVGQNPGVSNAFGSSQNSFDAGAKVFFLGRESRLRPFIGGGVGFSQIAITGNASYGLSSSTYNINQVNAYGELGAEFAITRAIVANAEFKMDGVMSNSGSMDSSNSGNSNDANLATVGNSLSHAANYSFSAGLGFYF
jgi:hypothetical protein